jgi:hypothetical protein
MWTLEDIQFGRIIYILKPIHDPANDGLAFFAKIDGTTARQCRVC